MTTWQLFFSFGGRLDRLHFMLGMIAPCLLGAILVLPPERYNAFYFVDDEKYRLYMLLLLWSFIAVSFWVSLSLMVRRFRDIGEHGWFGIIIFLLLPFSIIFFCLLLFLPSKHGANRTAVWNFLFSFCGRVGRLRFMMGVTALCVVAIASSFLLAGKYQAYGFISLVLFLLPSLWLFLSLSVRRFRDIGEPGRFGIITLLLLPFSILFICLLLLLPSTQGAKRTAVWNLLFSLYGRIDRIRFMGGIAALCTVSAASLFLFDSEYKVYGFVSVMLFLLPSLWVFLSLVVRRFHDFDESIWASIILFLFLPFLSLYLQIFSPVLSLFLLLMLMPGTLGVNSYSLQICATLEVSIVSLPDTG